MLAITLRLEKNLREDLNAVLYSPPPTCHTQVHAVGEAPTLGGQWNTAKEEEEGFLPHPGPASFSNAEEVSEMTVRMS